MHVLTAVSREIRVACAVRCARERESNGKI